MELNKWNWYTLQLRRINLRHMHRLMTHLLECISADLMDSKLSQQHAPRTKTVSCFRCDWINFLHSNSYHTTFVFVMKIVLTEHQYFSCCWTVLSQRLVTELSASSLKEHRNSGGDCWYHLVCWHQIAARLSYTIWWYGLNRNSGGRLVRVKWVGRGSDVSLGMGRY